jgi:hypothetical protein
MKRNLLMILVVGLTFFTSCKTVNKTMREPSTRLELEREDFELSSQVYSSASTTRILGIDWSRLFASKGGMVGTPLAPASFQGVLMPIIGNVMMDRTTSYALYKIMEENPGFDVILYPQYTTTVERPIGIGFLLKTTTVEVTARLGKLREK